MGDFFESLKNTVSMKDPVPPAATKTKQEIPGAKNKEESAPKPADPKPADPKPDLADLKKKVAEKQRKGSGPEPVVPKREPVKTISIPSISIAGLFEKAKADEIWATIVAAGKSNAVFDVALETMDDDYLVEIGIDIIKEFIDDEDTIDEAIKLGFSSPAFRKKFIAKILDNEETTAELYNAISEA